MNDIVFRSVAEIAGIAEKHSHAWLAWNEIGALLRIRYDPAHQVIEIDHRPNGRWAWLYEIDTERASSDSERWSWIRQLSGKLWATHELVGAVAEILFLLELGYLRPAKKD